MFCTVKWPYFFFDSLTLFLYSKRLRNILSLLASCIERKKNCLYAFIYIYIYKYKVYIKKEKALGHTSSVCVLIEIFIFETKLFLYLFVEI